MLRRLVWLYRLILVTFCLIILSNAGDVWSDCIVQCRQRLVWLYCLIRATFGLIALCLDVFSAFGIVPTIILQAVQDWIILWQKIMHLHLITHQDYERLSRLPGSLTLLHAVMQHSFRLGIDIDVLKVGSNYIQSLQSLTIVLYDSLYQGFH